MNAVEKLQATVNAAFDEADRQFNEEVRAIVAQHSAIGAIESGKTVKRIAKVVEDLAVAALRPGRVQAGSSPALRSKLPAVEEARLDQLMQAAEARLVVHGIMGGAAGILLKQAIARAREAKPPAADPKPSTLKARAVKAAAFVGRHVAASLLTLTLTLIAAFIVFKLGWN
nr:hypothetical protein [uncultured Brevundimonas sp.]